jgi:hypothetical protein
LQRRTNGTGPLLSSEIVANAGGARNPPATVIVPLMVAFGRAVAEKPTGEPVSAALVAVAVCAPTVAPRV